MLGADTDKEGGGVPFRSDGIINGKSLISAFFPKVPGGCGWRQEKLASLFRLERIFVTQNYNELPTSSFMRVKSSLFSSDKHLCRLPAYHFTLGYYASLGYSVNNFRIV